MAESAETVPGHDAKLVFRAGTHWYAIAALSVHSIVEPRLPVPVPGTPRLVRGVVNLQGRIATVMDVELLLETEQGAGRRAPESRFLVIDVGDGTVVLPAGEIAGFVEVPPGALLPVQSEGIHAATATFTHAGHFVTVLDAGMLLLQAETLLLGSASP